MNHSSKIQSVTQGVTASSAGMQEDRDCSVRALANAADISYTAAHAMLKKHGRKDRRGCFFPTLFNAYKESGFNLMGVYGSTNPARYAAYFSNMEAQEGITLKNLLPSLKVGEYIVNVCGHAVAIVNGKVLDTFDNAAGKRVVAVFKRIGIKQ